MTRIPIQYHYQSPNGIHLTTVRLHRSFGPHRQPTRTLRQRALGVVEVLKPALALIALTWAVLALLGFLYVVDQLLRLILGGA